MYVYSLQGECNLITCINIIIRLHYTVTSCVLQYVLLYVRIYIFSIYIYVRIYCMMDIKTECRILPLCMTFCSYVRTCNNGCCDFFRTLHLRIPKYKNWKKEKLVLYRKALMSCIASKDMGRWCRNHKRKNQSTRSRQVWRHQMLSSVVCRCSEWYVYIFYSVLLSVNALNFISKLNPFSTADI